MSNSSLLRICTLISLYFICILLPCFSLFDVDHFTITFASDETAATTTTVYFTLWWNHTIYQYSIYQPVRSGEYTATSSAYSIVGSSLCNPPAYKMRVELGTTDAAIIDSISVTLKDNTWFGVDAFCTPYRYGDGASWWTTTAGGSCTTTYHYDRFCIDSDITDCGPYQQMIYFDSNKPNQWHNTALIQDGRPSSVVITTCDPTQSPSARPTTNPSKIPSTSPSAPPSKNPSLAPSNLPSVSPTYSPLTPLFSPTETPTSPMETSVPSKDPSTSNPTLSPSPPAESPTADGFTSSNPTHAPSEEQSEPTETESRMEPVSEKEYSDFLIMLNVAGVAVGVCILCLLLFIVYKCYCARRGDFTDDRVANDIVVERVKSSSLSPKSTDDTVNISVTARQTTPGRNAMIAMNTFVNPGNHFVQHRAGQMNPSAAWHVARGMNDDLDDAASVQIEGVDEEELYRKPPVNERVVTPTVNAMQEAKKQDDSNDDSSSDDSQGMYAQKNRVGNTNSPNTRFTSSGY